MIQIVRDLPLRIFLRYHHLRHQTYRVFLKVNFILILRVRTLKNIINIQIVYFSYYLIEKCFSASSDT